MEARRSDRPWMLALCPLLGPLRTGDVVIFVLPVNEIVYLLAIVAEGAIE